MSANAEFDGVAKKRKERVIGDPVKRIESFPCFEGMKLEHLQIIGEHAEEKSFKVGEFIFHEEEPANRCYLIESGCVALEAHEPADGTNLIQVLTKGEILGWSWLIPPFRWHFTARVVEATNAIAIDGAHILVAAEEDHDFGYEIMKRIMQLLIHRLQTTRELLFKPPRSEFETPVEADRFPPLTSADLVGPREDKVKTGLRNSSSL